MIGRRSWRILFVLWQAWCLNVFLPAHTRGAMTVGEAASAPVAATHSCCAPKHRDEKPTPEQKSRCAVCYFAMGLSIAAVVDCRLFETGLFELLATPRLSALVSATPDLPFDACGPPALG